METALVFGFLNLSSNKSGYHSDNFLNVPIQHPTRNRGIVVVETLTLLSRSAVNNTAASATTPLIVFSSSGNLSVGTTTAEEGERRGRGSRCYGRAGGCLGWNGALYSNPPMNSPILISCIKNPFALKNSHLNCTVLQCVQKFPRQLCYPFSQLYVDES